MKKKIYRAYGEIKEVEEVFLSEISSGDIGNKQMAACEIKRKTSIVVRSKIPLCWKNTILLEKRQH